MKRKYMFALIATLPFLAGAGIPNFFSGMIGKNVHKYCEKPQDERDEVMQSVNMYTGGHKVVVVCSEKVAEAQPKPAVPRSRRIAR